MTAPTLETIFSDRRFFGIETATPVQRAICRICEGLPLAELASCDEVRDAVGGEEALAILTPGGFRPREVDIMAAIRSAKSRFAAAHAFWSSQIVVVDDHQAGETIRYPILSVNLTSATSTFDQLAGTMLQKPLMRALLVGEPTDGLLFIRHPSGRLVEVRVAAGARAGSNLVSVWLAGCTFEEYPRQAGEGQGAVVNYDQQLQAAVGRVVEGGQILSVGSPWAPFGPAYERFSTSFGRPSPERVVFKATGPAMNPYWWTRERCEALQKSNPQAYITDVLAGFADATTSFIPQSDVRAAVRKGGPDVVACTKERGYVAAMDPGTRGNAWTLVVVGSWVDLEGVPHYSVELAREWRGSSDSPLSPADILSRIAALIAPYHGCARVYTDQHSSDAIADLGRRIGLDVQIRTVIAGNAPEPEPGRKAPSKRTVYRNDLFETMAGIFASLAISIPNDRTLTSDLLSVRRVTTRTGVAYDLPLTGDGRHCDYVPALGLALSRFPSWSDARANAAYRARRAEQLARSLEGFELALYGTAEDYARRASRLAEQTRVRLNDARAASTQSPDWPTQERLEWNLVRFHQGSTPLKEEEIAELREHGRIPPEKPKE